MKKFFRGFTLAELLLCVGIIGIVSAMGMTIAKIGTDKAYNTFYYAGYINLYNAIADAKSQGKVTNVEIMNHAGDLLSKDRLVANSFNDGIRFLSYKAVWACTEDYIVNGNNAAGGKTCMDVPGPFPNNGCGIFEGRDYCIACPSGYLVNGSCTCKKISELGACLDEPIGPGIKPDGPITPDFPGGNCSFGQEEVNGVCQDKCLYGQIRDENGVCKTIQLVPLLIWPTAENGVGIETVNGIKYYYPNNLSDGMNGVQQLTGEISGVTNAFPITMTVPQRQTRTNNGIATVHLIYIDLKGGYLIPVTDNESVDLQNRRDLLPAYIDNGKVGRNSNVVNRANWTYERPAYRSYREAYCLLKGRTAINKVLSCDGISETQSGVLAIANPQKAR